MRHSSRSLNLSLASVSLAAVLATALGASVAQAGGSKHAPKQHASPKRHASPKQHAGSHGAPGKKRGRGGHGFPVHSGPHHHAPRCEQPPPPPPPPECPVFVPPSPLLTDSFETVAAPQATYTYAAPGLAAPSAVPFYASDGSWQGMAVSANPGTPTDADNNWSGFGVPVFGCVDAREFAGVRFKVEGDLGTCELRFGVVSRDNNSVLYGGGCTAEACYGPRSGPLSVGSNTLLFSDLTGGSPNPNVDASQINDIEWQLTAPASGVAAPCSANFTITEVAFVTQQVSSLELCSEFCALSVAPSQACDIQATVQGCLPGCTFIHDFVPQCEPQMVTMLQCMIAVDTWACIDTPSSIFPDPSICVPELEALQECAVAP